MEARWVLVGWDLGWVEVAEDPVVPDPSRPYPTGLHGSAASASNVGSVKDCPTDFRSCSASAAVWNRSWKEETWFLLVAGVAVAGYPCRCSWIFPSWECCWRMPPWASNCWKRCSAAPVAAATVATYRPDSEYSDRRDSDTPRCRAVPVPKRSANHMDYHRSPESYSSFPCRDRKTAGCRDAALLGGSFVAVRCCWASVAWDPSLPFPVTRRRVAHCAAPCTAPSALA